MRSLGALFGACMLLVACEQPGFECGTPAPDDRDEITRCDRAQEICVCQTRSCARVDVPGPAPQPACSDEDGGADSNTRCTSLEPTPAQACASGYRYVDTPYARSDWANRCVPKDHVSTADHLQDSSERGQACDPNEIRDAGPAPMMSMPDATVDLGDPDGAVMDASRDADGGDATVADGGDPDSSVDEDSGMESVP